MAIPVIMPKQGQSVETCIITRWFKSKGEPVSAGDILFSYETDKAAFDLESPADGILLEIFFAEGAEVPVLQNVAILGSAGESFVAPATGMIHNTGVTEPASPSAVTDPGASVAPAGPAGNEQGRIRISPRARRLAQSKSLDINQISGSGPYGRIITRDIDDLLTRQGPIAIEKQAADVFTDMPLTNVRKLIARAMHSSLQNSAQLTHHMSADVRKLLEARKKIKEELVKDPKAADITLNDMICWCIIKALKKFPGANSHFLDDRIRTFSGIHLGIAVDTERGLMVPSIKDADRMDLRNLSGALRAAATACRQGKIDPELIKSTSASFTVSNLGNYGVEIFTPVINLPQVAILGVCTIMNRPADLGNSTFGFIPVMGLSLTYDHRAIDGGPATLFLREIKEQIEQFTNS